MATSSVKLKLLVDKKSNRVLFAEASKEFVDFLFYILSLPAGTIISLSTKEGMVGSLGNLYGSLENLSTDYMQPYYQNKDCIWKPTIPNSSVNDNLLMLPNVDQSTTPKKFYRCASSGCSGYFSVDPSAKCPACNRLMIAITAYITSPSVEKGYVKEAVTYMVMDGLVVKPMSISSITLLLNNFNIKDIGLLENKEVTFGMDEAVKLIKASLESKTVLTDVFLAKKSPTHDDIFYSRST
jgi:hypothetical protein